jgi:outer membrane DcaP-like protein
MTSSRTRFHCNRWGALMIASILFTAGTLARADERKLSFTAPGTDTTVTIGGYVKLDAIWSNRSAGVDSVGDQLLDINSVPVGPAAGEHKTDQVSLHARQSRISLGTRTPTGYGDLTTLVEGDFFGAAGNESVSNSSGFRIRHAYGTLGKLSAGPYWTNFFNERAYPETVDFGGALGEILFARRKCAGPSRDKGSLNRIQFAAQYSF